ncbi:superoxide dismutase family protein [Robiginitalea sp. IMCC43444]|uniref:superoxide dismutase family protein n=1 Tax=Robiginitalea sp. IMCC43444 TaxID=3459121 RepID=UPI0040436275
MKRISLLLIGLLLISSYSCKQAKKEAEEASEAIEKSVEMVQEEVMEESIAFKMEPKSDSEVSGEVSFTEKDGMVSMSATFSGLTPGEHAIHIHEKADCSAADATSSGGHWNPTAEPHGKWGDEGGFHKGDIGNFTADAEGNAAVSFETDQWCIGCEDPNKNIVGKAVIVHKGKDDFTSQPSGAAGARVSCTGIIQ